MTPCESLLIDHSLVCPRFLFSFVMVVLDLHCERLLSHLRRLFFFIMIVSFTYSYRLFRGKYLIIILYIILGSLSQDFLRLSFKFSQSSRHATALHILVRPRFLPGPPKLHHCCMFASISPQAPPYTLFYLSTTFVTSLAPVSPVVKKHMASSILSGASFLLRRPNRLSAAYSCSRVRASLSSADQSKTDPGFSSDNGILQTRALKSLACPICFIPLESGNSGEIKSWVL